MAENISVDRVFDVPARSATAAATAAVPWYIWVSVLAVSCGTMGLHWDLSWHMTIGRDTFWTPAHVAMYLCGLVSGITYTYLIFRTTFRGTAQEKEHTVNVWGFRAPLGAFIIIWGCCLSLTSAPLDNWWHNAYGLDVAILSPAHALTLAGIFTIQLGSLTMILTHMNHSDGKLKERLNWLFLYIGAMMMILVQLLISEHTSRVLMHGSTFYRVVALAVPALMVGVARASGRRWACTTVIGIYTIFWLVELWGFPLFPARPKVGPVYQDVTHFIPIGFPLLLIVPAFFLDLLWLKIGVLNKWLQAALAGAVFVLVLLAVQWPASIFLVSPAARNWVFGSHYFAYFQSPKNYEVRSLFYPAENTALEFWRGIGIAIISAILTTRLGMAWGDWMKRVRR